MSADYANGPASGANGNASPRAYRERSRSPPRRRSPPVGGGGRRPQHIPHHVPPCNVLGVFGLSIMTKERDLEDEFSRYGPVEKATIVYDQRSDRSRGFGFVTMTSVEDATRCVQELNGLELHGRRMRVDYSTTHKPHNPTPGQYMGIRRDDAPYGHDRRGDHRHGGYERRDDRYASGHGSRRDNRDDRRSPPRRRYDDDPPTPRRRRSPSPHRQRDRDGDRRRRHSRSPSRSWSPPRRRGSREYDNHGASNAEAVGQSADGGRW